MTRFLARELSTAHWFNIDAARRDLGYEPRVSIEEGLRRLEEWFHHQNTAAVGTGDPSQGPYPQRGEIPRGSSCGPSLGWFASTASLAASVEVHCRNPHEFRSGA